MFDDDTVQNDPNGNDKADGNGEEEEKKDEDEGKESAE